MKWNSEKSWSLTTIVSFSVAFDENEASQAQSSNQCMLQNTKFPEIPTKPTFLYCQSLIENEFPIIYLHSIGF